MAAYRKSGGGNVAPTIVRRRSGGAWANVQTVKRRSGGTWVTVWSAYTPIAMSVSPTSISQYGTGSTASGGSGLSNPVMANAANGTGVYSYSWTRISGDTSTVISSTTAQSVMFSRGACMDGVDYTSVWRCTASDGTSSAYADVTVTLGYTGNR